MPIERATTRFSRSIRVTPLPQIHIARRLAALAISACVLASPVAAQSIIGPPLKSEPKRVSLTTPEKFFGFQMGADNKMAHWDDMVRYYDMLGKASNRMKVVNMGKTSEGRPFLALFISSPANLAKLEEYRGINAKNGRPSDVLPMFTTFMRLLALPSMS